VRVSAVCEGDSLGCSFDFRPGHRAHQALRRVREIITMERVNRVFDVKVQRWLGGMTYTKLRST